MSAISAIPTISAMANVDEEELKKTVGPEPSTMSMPRRAVHAVWSRIAYAAMLIGAFVRNLYAHMVNDQLIVVISEAGAVMPKRMTPGSAGYDLLAVEQVEIPPWKQALVSTGLKMKPPRGHYIRLAERSGLRAKHCVGVGAGVIDGDYTGVVKVCLYNSSDTPVKVEQGERIAQMIVEKCASPGVWQALELPSTDRGAGGFGSTGTGP